MTLIVITSHNMILRYKESPAIPGEDPAPFFSGSLGFFLLGIWSLPSG